MWPKVRVAQVQYTNVISYVLVQLKYESGYTIQT